MADIPLRPGEVMRFGIKSRLVGDVKRRLVIDGRSDQMNVTLAEFVVDGVRFTRIEIDAVDVPALPPATAKFPKSKRKLVR